MFCHVKYCRFNNTHVTSQHKCGKCNQYGHGGAECNNLFLKDKLKKYINYILPFDKYCTFGGCQHQMYHTIDAHHCTLCNERYHSKETCNEYLKNVNIKVQCPICKENNEFSYNQKKVYGQDENCCICLSNKVEVFFPSCGHVCVCKDCCITMCKKKHIYDEDAISRNYDIIKIKSYLKEYPSYIKISDANGIIIIRRLNINSSLEVICNEPNDITLTRVNNTNPQEFNITYGDYDIFTTQENADFIKGYANIGNINDNFKLL